MDPFRTAAAPTMPCPRCAIGLGSRHVIDAVIDECADCRGVFVPGDLVPRLLDPLDLGLEVVETFPPGMPASEGAVHYLACPRCKALMNRRLLVRGSNVIVDQCRRHGVWFDEHELRRLAELASQNDVKLKAEPPPAWERKAMAEQEEERRRRAAELTHPIGGGTSGLLASFLDAILGPKR